MAAVRAQELMDQIAACEEKRAAAVAAYVTPHDLVRQDLLAELGAAISGFTVGDTITSKRLRRSLTITHLSAVFYAGTTYYWTAHGIGAHGSESIFGFPYDEWHLAELPPPH